LVLACRAPLGEFFLRYGLVDHVIEIDKRSVSGRREALRILRERSWDHIFVPHESVRTALWLMRVRARVKVGFRQWWNWQMWDRRVVKPQHLPDALRQLSLLAGVDSRTADRFGEEGVSAFANAESLSSPLSLAEPQIPEWASMKLRVRGGARGGARAGNSDGDRGLLFLAPGSVWATKRWTYEGYRELAKLALNKGYRVELVGSPAERELCESLAREVSGLKSHAGKTSLSELVELLSTGQAIICNDSGAMHAAACADLPTVAVFGPTTLALGFRPWNSRAVVVQKDLNCRPCGKHGAKKCPLGTHECMRSLSASQVWSALEMVVKQNEVST